MSDTTKQWEYWNEPDYPKHNDCCDGWNGPNSDPDHCVARCEETIGYLLSKVQSAQAKGLTSRDEEVKRLEAKVKELGKEHKAHMDYCDDRGINEIIADHKAKVEADVIEIARLRGSVRVLLATHQEPCARPADCPAVQEAKAVLRSGEEG